MTREPPDSREVLWSPSLDAELARRAERQHAIFTTDELSQMGLGRSGIDRRLKNGRLHRLHRGIYLLGRPTPTRHGRWLAAVRACGLNTVLSHRSSGALHGLRRSDPSMIDVTTTDRGRRHEGIRIHEARRLDPLDVTTVDHIPATTVARTLLDLADVARTDELAKAIHEAEYGRLFDLRAIEATIARNPGRKGIARLEAAIATYRPLGETNLEDDLDAIVEEAGFEPAERNAGVDTGTRVVHPDFHWPARKLCLEADGSVHKTTRKFYEDRWRDRELFLIGISTLRYTDEDVYAAGPATLEERAGSSTAPARPG